ncbi:ACT domain-containing protein [Acidovorax sp. SUPP3334]|uniref:ACT domain-containing protein n=1 Tax=Acidovorax sp. SUPP3334 TaxID=2920881 RepID=UPI0023DE55E8|nr:ACT domain-containing protein [Acidovorax sp. SUPP3334]GKT24488.1 ACT domain-containing protein [Acidovorax sp. SUPP3334]
MTSTSISTPSSRSITLATLPSRYAVARLLPQAAIPPWADGPGFVSISRSGEELSITCLQERVPEGVQADRGWVAFRFVGPFAFGETGIVLSVIRPLSENGIGIFVVSTFDGDHLLLAEADCERACTLLAGAGHRVLPLPG